MVALKTAFLTCLVVTATATWLIYVSGVDVRIEMLKQITLTRKNKYQNISLDSSKMGTVYSIKEKQLSKRGTNSSKVDTKSSNASQLGINSSKEVTKSSNASKMGTKMSESKTNYIDAGTSSLIKGQYIIYECSHRTGGCGGWADRQKGIVMTYLISLITRRKFGIIITSPECNLTDYFRPNLIDWNLDLIMLNKLTSERIDCVDDIDFYEYVNNINFTAMMTKDVVYFSTNYEFTTALQSNFMADPALSWMKRWKYTEVFTYVLKTLFTLNKRVDSVLQSFMNKARPNKEWKLICAHIRMGKNPTIPNDSETRNSAESIEVVWKFLKTNLTCHQCKLFIATDSEDVRKQAKTLFPDQIVDITGNIQHLDKGDADPCGAFQKIILDQEVLSRCDSLIISHSGLGRIAAYQRQPGTDLYCLIHGAIIKCLPHELLQTYRIRGNL